MHHWFLLNAKFRRRNSPLFFRLASEATTWSRDQQLATAWRSRELQTSRKLRWKDVFFSQKVTWFIWRGKGTVYKLHFRMEIPAKGSWFTWCMDEVSSTMQVRLTRVPNDHESRSTVCFSCCSKGKRKRLQQHPWSWVVSSSSPYFSEPAEDVAEILKKHLAKLHDLHRHSFKKPFNKHGLLPLLVTPKRIQQRKAMMHETKKTEKTKPTDVFSWKRLGNL